MKFIPAILSLLVLVLGVSASVAKRPAHQVDTAKLMPPVSVAVEGRTIQMRRPLADTAQARAQVTAPRMTGIELQLLPRYQKREINPAVWWMAFIGALMLMSFLAGTMFSHREHRGHREWTAATMPKRTDFLTE
jgi:hypothetical protein